MDSCYALLAVFAAVPHESNSLNRYSLRVRAAASRPEVVRQAICAVVAKSAINGEPRRLREFK